MITCEGIIRNIRSNNLSSLYSDIKSILGASKSDSFCVSLCQILKALCKHVISLDKCSEELPFLEPSVRLCLDHLQKHYQSDHLKNFQFDRILYYIITSFIKSKLYESAQYFAECLKAYLKDLSILTEDSTLAVIKNVSIIVWNAALEYEQHSGEKDKYVFALQFRAVGLDFMLMDKQCKETVVDKVCIALQKYWVDNPNHDMFQCSAFFKNIWTQMLMRKVYVSDHVIFFKLCYFFNNFLLKYGRRNEFFMEVIACLQLLYKQLILEEEKNEEAQVLIDILKFCIKIFTVRSSTTISPKTFSLWMMTFKALHTSEDFALLYNTLHIFHLHFCDCASYLSLHQLSDDMKDFLKTVSMNLNVFELLVNEYLKFSSIELHKDPTSLLTCKIRISSALIRFYHFVLQNEPDKKKNSRLSKKACQFVNQCFLFLNCKTLEKNNEEEKAFLNFGITVCNLAKMFYKSHTYEEVVQLFPISIAIDLSSTEIKDKDTHMLNLWTKQELLIYSHLLLHNHKEALINVVKALSLHENKTKECLELWMKIKRDVLRLKDTTMASKTIADVITESDSSFTTEKIILLLIEELKYCEMERCNMTGEMLSVANKLLAMHCTGIIRANMLFELVSSPVFVKNKNLLLDGKGSLVELCQEAIQLYTDYLEKTPSDNEIKLKLSVVYFWFHLITFRQMHVIIETEAKKEIPPSPVNETKVQINDDEDDTCDIQPGIQFVTLSVETKALENLDHAFQLWTEISLNSDYAWMELKDIVKDLGILDLIHTSAQTFATAVHDLKEWRFSVLLLEVAIATGSKIHELIACTSLIKFAVRLGYLEIADHFVIYGLALLKSETIGEKHIYQTLRFYLAQSNYYLHVEKYDEGLEILQNVLTDSIFDYQSTKSSKLLKSEILLVLSHYLALPESTFSNRQNFRNLSSSTTSLNAANECALICQSLFIYESSEENQNSDVLRNDSLYYKSRLIHTLLVSHLLIGQLFVQIGAPREARCYLQQGLVIAQPHILTYWCSKFLTILGQLDLLCDSSKDCVTKLNGLKYIMNNELKETIAAVLLKHYENIDLTEQPTSPEENFIVSKPGRDVKGEIRQKFLEKYNNVFASPVAKWNRSRVVAHRSLDEYNRYGLFSLQFARFEIYMLKSLQLVTEGSIEAAIDELRRTLLEYEILCNSTALSDGITSVKSHLIQNFKNVRRTPQEVDAHIVINTSIQLSIIYSSCGKFNEANDQINHAHKFLQSLTESPKIYHNLYCLVKYREVITSIKSLICSKSHTRVEYQLFPVRKRTQFAQSKISNKSSLTQSALLRTPKMLPVPKIYVTDFATNDLCHAPTKKDVLPAHIKQDLDSPNLDVPQTPTFTPLYFSSSESDDSAFITQKKSESRNKKTLRSKRLMWNKSSKDKTSSDDKIDYKFFKSKSINTISSSGDIWRLPISSPPSEMKCTQQRKTRSSRSTTKNKICHPLSGLTKAPQKKHIGSKKLVQSMSVEIYDDEKLKIKNQIRKSRPIFKSTSDSVERARSSSRSKRGDCSQDSSDEENNHFVISDIYESDVFGKSKSPIPEIKEVTSLFSDLCDDFGSISVSNEDIKVKITNASDSSQESHKKRIKSVIPGEKMQQFIRQLSEIRLLMQHNPTFPLYSDVCKLLAFLIITEPSDHQNDFEEQMLKSGFLLSETFAITLHHHFISTTMKKVKKGEQSFEGQLLPTMQENGHVLPEMMKSMIKTLPEDWTVVQISTFSEKEAAFDTGKHLLPKLIVCQYRKNTLPVVCCIDHTQDDKFTSSFFEDFEDIQKQNVLIMSNKEKNSWWKSRITLNKRLKELSDCMENIWLGCWKGLLLGLSTDKERIQRLKDATDEIMEIAPTKNKQLLQVILDSASFLRRDQISEAVCCLWECTPFDDIYSKICNSISNLSSSFKQCERHPVILILDKDIQVLPWECMPILKDIPVSRVPSMSLLMSQLNSKSFSKVQNGVDNSKTFYILNPSGDLSDTQERFEDSFKRQSEWKGIAGRIPTTKEYLSAFEENEIFIYCGHGSGRIYLKGTSIDRVRCQAATVLMGCSSGSLKQLGRQFEPQGIAFRYWLNGSPCVVANLWDVTDKDIDKFTEEFLSMWMPNYKTDNSTVYNVSKAASVSRKVCKLKYLIGAAPVVFGLPVFVRK